MSKPWNVLGLVLSLGILGTSVAFAAETPIAACSVKQLADLEVEIVRWEADGYRNIRYMKNGGGDILGFFASDGEVDVYAEVCESIDDSTLTVSNEWYYWDDGRAKSEPATWKAGQAFRISQDEGLATIRVVEPSAAGDVTAVLTILGWDENSVEHIVRQDTVSFQAR